MDREIKLVCDNFGCTFEGLPIVFEDMHEYINKPCPVCSENLLTYGDFQRTVDLVEKFEALNAIQDMQNSESDDDTEQMYKYHFSTHKKVNLDSVEPFNPDESEPLN